METYLSAPEIAEKLGIHKATIWRWCKRGLFPKPIKVGQRVIAWPVSEIEAWEKERIAERRETARH